MRHASLLQNGPHVGEGQSSLLLDVLRHVAGGGVYSQLTRDVQRAVGQHRLTGSTTTANQRPGENTTSDVGVSARCASCNTWLARLREWHWDLHLYRNPVSKSADSHIDTP